MSVLQTPMYSNQLNPSFSAGPRHIRKPSFENLLASFSLRPGSRKIKSVSPSICTSPGSSATQEKRKPHIDETKSYLHLSSESPVLKRPKTIPSSSLSEANLPVFAEKIKLPSISDALANTKVSDTGRAPSLRPLAPTVSLDYFDTYKPNDENWRYRLLDTIRNSKLMFSLGKYAYVDEDANNKRLPSIHEFEKNRRPCFDSRVSCKALPTLAQRKINFPYESNYTYLNKTYLKDVEKFPEYLELAQLLVQLSRPASPIKEQRQKSVPEGGYQQQQHHHIPTERQFSQEHMGPSSVFAGHRESSLSAQFLDCSVPENQPSNRQVVQSPSSAKLQSYLSPDRSCAISAALSPLTHHREHKEHKNVSTQRSQFISVMPQAVKDKLRLKLVETPPRASQPSARVCISCGSDQSPSWRPSWSIQEGQLCNSCGLRYKKTATRCLNSKCKKIPAKGEWALMQSKGEFTFDDGERAYECLSCGWKVEVKG